MAEDGNKGDDDTFDVSDSSMELLKIVERIERLIEEKQSIADDIKDVKAEAKARGFDPRIIMRVIALRKMTTEDRAELDALIETYRTAVGI